MLKIHCHNGYSESTGGKDVFDGEAQLVCVGLGDAGMLTVDTRASITITIEIPQGRFQVWGNNDGNVVFEVIP
jgi:hypothetical protein